MCLEAGTEQIPYDFEKNHTGFAMLKILLSQALHIHYFESKQEKYAISTKDKAFTLTTDNQKKWSDYIGLKPSSKYRKIIIQVPQMNIQEMSLSSNGGNLLFEKLNVRKKT